MESRQLALKLVLDAIGEDDSIGSVDDRVRIQKAVYLTQELGINLGYSYSWYVKGPYSTALTRDYYALAESAPEQVGLEGKILHPQLNPLIARITQLLRMPENCDLSRANWYELLASLHFLLRRHNFNDASAHMNQAKPHLKEYLWLGYEHLKANGLVNA